MSKHTHSKKERNNQDEEKKQPTKIDLESEKQPKDDTATEETQPTENVMDQAEANADEAVPEKEEGAVSDQPVVAQQDFDDLQDKHLRLTAEFDNFRKRSRKEQEASYQRAKVDLVKDFLPLLDALDRAQASYEKLECENSESLIEGMALLGKQAEDCLHRIGVEEIEALGQNFDPVYHEAVQHIEDANMGTNEVAQVLLKGYQAGDTVIRHSLVIVAN
ncbi:MAG: nucleotide exchange factor GrpE [Eubacteriales bacterium]|nr:nucleotide exchange factor GrpE [Eubacteriales bacterium]